MSGYRLDKGGLVDRSTPLRFHFDGKVHQGFAGDSLGSALLANGVGPIARSFKYHRPRGLYAAGIEEPTGLVTVGNGGRTEPNIPAPAMPLYDGLVATSQNSWPSPKFDLQAVNGWFSRLLVAGFYYKTFIGPTAGAWMFYEKFIRRAAGMGRGTLAADPDRHETSHAFCDVLVVGGGPAGLMAAATAAAAGRRVILAEADRHIGGGLLGVEREIDGMAGHQWVAQTIADLAARTNVTVMPNTMIYGAYDGGQFGAVERVAEDCPEPPPWRPRQRHWTITADQVVVATGAIERPLVFGDNDRPGIMLASAVRTYALRYGVAPGRSVALFTNNDSTYGAARDLIAAGVQVVAIVDARPTAPAAAALLGDSGVQLITNSVVTRARGAKALKTVEIAGLNASRTGLAGATATLAVDCLGVSGGWTPTLHLMSQAGAVPEWDAGIAAFTATPPTPAWHPAGAVTGRFGLAEAMATGITAGRAASRSTMEDAPALPHLEGAEAPYEITPLFEVPTTGRGKKFVDLQNDVTADDIRLSEREGYQSVEHLKRYTTLGMGADQGKTSNVNALAIMAAARQQDIADVGTTRFRPPYAPVALGTLTGRTLGRHYRPTRLTPMHEWHVAHGADMMNAGAWQRPRAYLRPGETLTDAYIREATAVRATVGIVDVSTLGKIDVQGPDAGTFLNRVYVNGFAKLPVGKARYGLMLREDGFLFDDGTTWRLDEHRYLMTTTTANAAPVLTHLEYLLGVIWPDLRVAVTSVTEQWAGVAVAGPEARMLLESVVEDLNLSNAAFPFMAVGSGRIGQWPVLVARLSFSGELAYEVYIGAHLGEALWLKLMIAGAAFDVTPYGTEALGTLRIEKGHVAGPELDGRTTVADLGLARMASTKKHFVGQRLMNRPALTDPLRPRLVGLVSEDHQPLRAGAHLVTNPEPAELAESQGHVTSTTYSPATGQFIALGLLRDGPERESEVVYAAHPLKGLHQPVKVVSPHFFDPDGERMHV